MSFNYPRTKVTTTQGVRKWHFLLIYSTIFPGVSRWVGGSRKSQKHADVILEWSHIKISDHATSVLTLFLRWQQHRESQAMGTIFLFWLICSCWEIVSPSVLIYGLQEEVADWNLDSYQVLLTKLHTSERPVYTMIHSKTKVCSAVVNKFWVM